MSPIQFERAKERHAFVGGRLLVPHVLHNELRTKLGGLDPEAKLQGWYANLDAEAESTGEAIPDVFVWLRPRFVAWVPAQAPPSSYHASLRAETLAHLKRLEESGGY
jgi:hypothetical protein